MLIMKKVESFEYYLVTNLTFVVLFFVEREWGVLIVQLKIDESICLFVGIFH